jgi:hypothetical protein
MSAYHLDQMAGGQCCVSSVNTETHQAAALAEMKHASPNAAALDGYTMLPVRYENHFCPMQMFFL